MSGFPAIRPGLKLKPVGKQGLMSRNQANTVLAVCNGVLNSKLIDTDSDEFHITPNNAVYGIGRNPSASASSTAMYPFKIYPTGTTKLVAGIVSIGFNVRVGFVDIRPLFHSLSIGIFDAKDVYAATVIPAGSDVTFGPSDYIPSPLPSANTFFLDPTLEIISGTNYGAYYAFYIKIDPDTDNGGLWNGAVTVIARRFSIGTSPTDPFPGIPNGGSSVDGIEYIRIGIVQLKAATTPLFSVDGQNSNGLIWQMIHEHQTNRFPAGQSSLNGFCWQGIWDNTGTPDAGLASGNRYWYPGDTIGFYTGTPAQSASGLYIWTGAPGHLGGTPTGPQDGSSNFLQVSKGDFF